MMPDQFEIINAFSTALNVELTINQIAKKIKKSYAFTNKYTHDLIKKDILHSKVVGSALLCKLNFQNEATIACLVYNSMQKTIKAKPNYKAKHPGIIFLHKNKLYRLKKDSFKHDIKKYDFSKIIVLQGHERFWRLVAEVVL